MIGQGLDHSQISPTFCHLNFGHPRGNIGKNNFSPPLLSHGITPSPLWGFLEQNTVFFSSVSDAVDGYCPCWFPLGSHLYMEATWLAITYIFISIHILCRSQCVEILLLVQECSLPVRHGFSSWCLLPHLAYGTFCTASIASLYIF